MADKDQVRLLQQGVDAWNTWRAETSRTGQYVAIKLDGAELGGANLPEIDFSGANLRGACLIDANLSGAKLDDAVSSGAFPHRVETNLSDANLRGANLRGANLSRADLSYANFSGANLANADLSRADLDHASCSGADLSEANFREANLTGTNFSGARTKGATVSGATFGGTILANVSLSDVTGLNRCRHSGPSSIDYRTLQQSGRLPLPFLRGVGLPDNWIEYLPSLTNEAIQHYSCFISYSSKDQKIADRLYADLQNEGVRCWFAPHDLPIGANTWDVIDEAIRLRDKLLLILSGNSIASDWVEDEVNKGFSEERTRKQLVLFPIRIDDSVMTTTEPWAVKLRDQRNIGDFRDWSNHDGYQKRFARLLRDLKVSRALS
jgi:uncharacterized protein YjbI with pentapeptide repeats